MGAKGGSILEPIAKACQAAKEKHKVPAGQTPNYDAIVAEMESHKDNMKKMRSTLDEVQAAAEKAEVDQCNASCAETRAKIEGLRTSVLPDIQKKGPGQADLDGSGPIGDVCPEMTGMLAEAQAAIAKTEEL